MRQLSVENNNQIVRRNNRPNKYLHMVVSAVLFLSFPSLASAQDQAVSLQDSFSIGDNGGTLCQVQNRSQDKMLSSIFDRSWAIVCRDSALPVGNIFALRAGNGSPETRLANRRAKIATCSSGPMSSKLGGRSLTQQVCTLNDQKLSYSVFRSGKGKTQYFAEGFSAYNDALLLGLKSIQADKIAKGRINVATTSIEDPLAFARVQAATLDPAQALAEGYRRNNSGDYAEASEYFETLEQRVSDGQTSSAITDSNEYLLNQALQKSNLGQFSVAETIFENVRQAGSARPISRRLQRNFEAIHLLNQQKIDAAIARLNRPISSTIASSDVLRSQLKISDVLAQKVNNSSAATSGLNSADERKLTEEERAQIIDAQARHLLGTAYRLKGDYTKAKAAQIESLASSNAVRNGRITSIIRLRAQILTELALTEESQGNFTQAEAILRRALTMLSGQYPETRTVNGARARLASFLVRRGKEAQALPLYKQVIQTSVGKQAALSGITNQIAPYFSLLTKNMPTQPEAASDFFNATQILIRPGVAETQAILSRELSGGSNEASRLFRQSTNIARNIERLRIDFLALGRAEQTPAISTLQKNLAEEIAALEIAQQEAIVRLSKYPQYTAIASRSLDLKRLQSNFKAGEIYLKMAVVGSDIYVFFADSENATAYKTGLSVGELDNNVDALRETISTVQDGNYVTVPFDVTLAHKLYSGLFAPVANKVRDAKHIIFEPDGAMLRLPLNLLVTDKTSVDAYDTAQELDDADPFNFADMAWVGRGRTVSTAVSSRSFTDARAAPASSAKKQYLGMGRNIPVFGDAKYSGVRSAAPRGKSSLDKSCTWPLNEWNKPISDTELNKASSKIGKSTSTILTGNSFSDDKIKSLKDLDNYRILHFATHGLVTPPRPECPAKPALLTSFGEKDSDGLLSFEEIFDLKLDADIVILSACDTAGKASISATRSAGVTTGGGTSLDGLVRAFIGAGGRSILASHWPAPDDYQATEKLIGGLFDAKKGQSIGGAMRDAQLGLMDNPLTSHPYYWAGFAIIGDGDRPLLNDETKPTVGEATAD